jgi:hypothetical protein
MSIFEAFKKGAIPADTGEPVYDGWEEVPPDPHPTDEGDNSKLMGKYGHLIAPDQVARHLLEEDPKVDEAP